MIFWLFFAVVVTTAIFLSLFIKMKQKEIRSTQELLLQFIDQFEAQHQEIVNQFEKYKQTMDEKYENVIRMIRNDGGESIQKLSVPSRDSIIEEPIEEIDPLHIRKRYGAILQLRQEGKTADEIARISGRGKGEILLILELLEKQLDHS